MAYFLKTIACLCGASANICMKQYTKKTGDLLNGNYAFNFVIGVIALIFYAVSGALSDGLTADASVIPFAILYGVAYVFGSVGCILAMAHGSLLITLTVCGMGNLIPIVYSIFGFGETPTPTMIIGMILVFTAAFLLRGTSKKDDASGEKKKSSPMFWVYLFFGFAGNGVAMLAARLQQYYTPGQNASALLFYGIGIATVIFFLMMLIFPPRTPDTHSVRDAARTILPALGLALVYGLCNAASNFLTTITLSLLPTIVSYMFTKGFGIVLSFATSRFLYREKLQAVQYVGYGVALVGTILLTAF